MTTSNESPPPEYSAVYRPHALFQEAPFDTTAFDQRTFAERIVQALDFLGQGAVIAIDAPWGHGKTYFGRNLQMDLRNKGWKAMYVDAFEADYVEDPFVLLAARIKDEATDSKKRQSLVKGASAVGKALLPITAKAIARIATAGALSGEQLEEASKALADASGDAALKLVEGRIKDFEKDRESVSTFKKSIAELAASIQASTGHPLVVFVDELDRCRPDFAVRMLERMKHFFDVPALVFVLLLNKEQLERAVNGVYGAGIDADSYLRKFIHLTFELPIRLRLKQDARNERSAYVLHLANKIQLGQNQKLVGPFTEMLSELASTLGISLRDIERCFTLFVFAGLKAKLAAELAPFLGFIVVLKVVYPVVYEQVLLGQASGRQSVQDLLRVAEERGLGEYWVKMLDAMVTAHVGGKVPAEAVEHFRHNAFRFNLEPVNTFRVLASFVDARAAR
jgi:hypothetical protein